MASASLEEKINKIRQKNEEIRRRHEEVEADKQNAAKLNALVKMVPPTDWPERKEPPEFSNPPPPRSNGNSKSKTSIREYRGGQQQYHAGGGDGKKIHVFAEGDGPPPDPTYNFLADSEREERNREDLRDNDRFRGRGGPLRGSSRRRGGGREGYSKEYRGSAAPKDATKPEYEAWRAERNRIDEARISRQRTAEGNWRREWDNNKINVEEDDAGATKSARLDIGDVVKKDHKEFDKWQVDGNDHDSPRGRGGKQYINRGAPRGSHNNRAYHHSNSFEQFHGPVSPSTIKPPLSPNGIDERTVVATDKSIKVIVNHGTTIPKGPVMSVKVSSSSIAGTGRVGPRQKPRILYSSQSETEIVGHEHEKFPGYKSSDDKTNRVSFNRDIDEQQRYLPKSPHPHRKAENNSKSPYLSRKEFKYDSQQQRHGEIDAKSPYQQRKEIKDCPKSPHFQKKADFTNRDSHIKQKNNSVTDSFKPTHSQRRTLEKTKYDLQKLPATKKLEDTFTPKPQRMNKRTDKSKNFQRSNSKETQECSSNESNSQLNDLGTSTVKESIRKVDNGTESYNEVNNTNNNCKEDVFKDPVPVETVEENQNENFICDLTQLNIDSETFSISLDLENVDKSIPDDTISIDNSRPVILTHKEATECPESVKENVVNTFDTVIEKELIVKNVETKTEAESATLHTSESKTDECNETVNYVETKTEAKSATLHSNENKTDECNETVMDVEVSKELLKIMSVTEEVEVQTIIENNTENKNEIININKICEDKPKQERNLIPSTDADKLDKLKEEAVTAKSELQNKITKEKIFLEPKKKADEIEQARNIVESTSEVEKVELAHETEAHLTSEEQVSNDTDKQTVKETIKIEKVSNDIDDHAAKDSTKIEQVSNDIDNQVVKDSTEIEQVSSDIDSQVVKDSTKIEQVSNDIDSQVVKDSTKIEPVSNDIDSQVVKDSTKIEQVSNDIDSQVVKDSTKIEQVSNDIDSQVVKDSTKIEPVSNDIDSQVVKDSTKIEQVSNDIDSQVVKDSTTIEQVSNDIDSQVVKDSTKIGQVSNYIDSQVVKDSTKIEQVSNDIDSQVVKDSTKIEQVSNDIDSQVVNDSTTIEQVSNDIDNQVVKDSTKIDQVSNDINDQIVKDSEDEKNSVI